METQELREIIEELLNAEISFCPTWTSHIDETDVEKLTDTMMQKVTSLPIVKTALKTQPELRGVIREKVHDFLMDNAEHATLCDDYDTLTMPIFYVYVFTYVCDELGIC